MQHQSQASERDDSLVSALYTRYAPAILASLRRHLTSLEDAEDVLLEVFVAALEHSETLECLAQEQQLAWLRRVAHNKYVDHLRHKQRRPAVPLGTVEETMCEDEAHAPEQIALRSEEHAELRARLHTLPKTQQEILHLRFAGGLRTAEIAKLLNKSDLAIRIMLSRSMNLLRRIYEREQGRQKL